MLKLWQGLGYYSRARNLHFSAKHISENLNSVFPKNFKDLLQLKGVGDYTASAISSICYEESVAVVDGNVYRVLARYFGIDTPINTTEGVKQFKTLATSLLPLQIWVITTRLSWSLDLDNASLNRLYVVNAP